MKKYLDFYERCIAAGRLVSIDNSCKPGGLCGALSTRTEQDKSVDIFEPTEDDCNKYGVVTWWYWAAEGFAGDGEFNDFRQNIVLFLAAMNNEL